MNNKSRAGRPRSFDTDEVLSKVMGVFWSRGFDGTSMSDLVAASGVQKASLYAAFGDKQSLYLKALALYDDGLLKALAKMLAEAGSPRKRFRRVLEGGIARAASGDRSGCFLCAAAEERSGHDADTSAVVQLGLARMETIFADALANDIADPSVRTTAARHLLAIYVAIQSLARAGYPAQSLDSIMSAALATIPGGQDGDLH